MGEKTHTLKCTHTARQQDVARPIQGNMYTNLIFIVNFMNCLFYYTIFFLLLFFILPVGLFHLVWLTVRAYNDIQINQICDAKQTNVDETINQ